MSERRVLLAELRAAPKLEAVHATPEATLYCTGERHIRHVHDTDRLFRDGSCTCAKPEVKGVESDA